MSQIPFPKMGTGTASATVGGYVGYANDMKAIQCAFMNVLFGMASEHNKNNVHAHWIVGEDYDDPDLLLDAIKKWIDMRSEQGWEIGNEYSFDSFKEDARRKMRENDNERF
jgi:hypothetical protein